MLGVMTGAGEAASASGDSPIAGPMTSGVAVVKSPDGGVAPAGGRYDMQFGLWNAPTGGVRVGGPLALEAVVNTNGVFSVSLDFGAGGFDGSVRWLEVSVRTNGSTAPYQVLSLRQAIAFAPQAIFALTVADGSVTDAKLVWRRAFES